MKITDFMNVEEFLYLVRKKLRQERNGHSHTKKLDERTYSTTFYHTTKQVDDVIRSILSPTKAKDGNK